VPPLNKGLYQVSWFAQLLKSLTDLATGLDWEAAAEMDDSRSRAVQGVAGLGMRDPQGPGLLDT
jgi:hypothetical protein